MFVKPHIHILARAHTHIQFKKLYLQQEDFVIITSSFSVVTSTKIVLYTHTGPSCHLIVDLGIITVNKNIISYSQLVFIF